MTLLRLAMILTRALCLNPGDPSIRRLIWFERVTRFTSAGEPIEESNTFYPNGTQAAPITIAGYPGEVTIIDGNSYQIPSKNSGDALIQVYGDWYIILNLTITKSGDQGVSVHGIHDTIDNVYSHHNWGWGIVMTGNNDITQNSQVWSNSMI